MEPTTTPRNRPGFPCPMTPKGHDARPLCSDAGKSWARAAERSFDRKSKEWTGVSNGCNTGHHATVVSCSRYKHSFRRRTCRIALALAPVSRLTTTVPKPAWLAALRFCSLSSTSTAHCGATLWLRLARLRCSTFCLALLKWKGRRQWYVRPYLSSGFQWHP